MTNETTQKAVDKAIAKAARTAVGSLGAPFEMLIDRMLTFAIAQMVAVTGKADAVRALRECAANVEAGIFDHLDPTTPEAKH